MPDGDPAPKPPSSQDELAKQVGLREERMLRKQKQGTPNFWRAVALVGFVGWSVVLPMLIGVAAGLWIDNRWPSRYSWTLMLLVAGLAVGCTNAWNRIRQAEKDR
jgi:ATP synthase protein I